MKTFNLSMKGSFVVADHVTPEEIYNAISIPNLIVPNCGVEVLIIIILSKQNRLNRSRKSNSCKNRNGGPSFVMRISSLLRKIFR
jgi:hypothetical protein